MRFLLEERDIYRVVKSRGLRFHNYRNFRISEVFFSLGYCFLLFLLSVWIDGSVVGALVLFVAAVLIVCVWQVFTNSKKRFSNKLYSSTLKFYGISYEREISGEVYIDEGSFSLEVNDLLFKKPISRVCESAFYGNVLFVLFADKNFFIGRLIEDDAKSVGNCIEGVKKILEEDMKKGLDN